jgi:hypothetical protein
MQEAEFKSSASSFILKVTIRIYYKLTELSWKQKINMQKANMCMQ